MSGRVRMGVVGISLLVVAYVVGGSLLGRTAGEGAYKQLAVFGEVLSRIQSDYVEEPNLQRVTVGALHGLLAELDPYSGYMSPREYAEYQQKQPPPEGRVGVVLSKRFWLASVVAVLPGSPAARAGLQTGDLLESIAGFSTREMSIEQAEQLLAGEPGTAVKVAVVRQQRPEPQALELVRARLGPLRVLSQRLEGGAGYVKVAAFAPGTAGDVRAALRQLQASGSRQLVLDLRDAAAGPMEEAIETARLFLDKGLITYTLGQQMPRRQFTAEAAGQAWKEPMVVLISHATAGPGEVVAAALQSNHRATVVGLRSYGVGSVQRLIPLDDGAALILTVAKYYSPAGKALQDNGVTPDVEAQPSEGQVLAPVPHAPPRPDDPVLEKGLEVLRTQAEAEPARKAA